MGVKFPTTSGVITTTGTKSGLNEIVEYIGTVFDTQFNDSYYPSTTTLPTETILHVFGLVERFTDEDGKSVPLAYNNSAGTLTDQITLMPSDRYPGFMFFDYDDPVLYSAPKKYVQTAVSWSTVTVKLNMVFWFNMKRSKYYTKWGSDYRSQKEALRSRIMDVVQRHLPKKGCELSINGVFDKSVVGVFKNYNVEDYKLMADLYPYYCIRVETTVSYNESCS